MGRGVPWGNCKVLYQDLPFNQDREHEVLMTQFEQGYLDPKGCRKTLTPALPGCRKFPSLRSSSGQSIFFRGGCAFP